ncbi:hypothetical protein NM688_g6046 [Phlebia brevispora]|uniref:Uncharacterized protein n=1 Tax=Phlebia brevispora TaxID=194682 RepID=A0ACC1SKI2_9APHY|nr:hypothetical protein NM688_g6046 [Phlebia brevispora]
MNDSTPSPKPTNSQQYEQPDYSFFDDSPLTSPTPAPRPIAQREVTVQREPSLPPSSPPPADTLDDEQDAEDLEENELTGIPSLLLDLAGTSSPDRPLGVGPLFPVAESSPDRPLGPLFPTAGFSTVSSPDRPLEALYPIDAPVSSPERPLGGGPEVASSPERSLAALHANLVGTTTVGAQLEATTAVREDVVIPVPEPTEVTEEVRRRNVYLQVIELLAQEKCSWGELVEFVSNPANAQDQTNPRGRAVMQDWILKRITKQVEREGENVTKSGLLRTEKRSIDAEFASSFSLRAIRTELDRLCPQTLRIITAFCTTRKQQLNLSDESKDCKATLVTSAVLTCLGERSQKNNYTKAAIGLYAYAEGARRQVISVLSRLGLSMSYTALVENQRFLREDAADSSSVLETTESAVGAKDKDVIGTENDGDDEDFESAEQEEYVAGNEEQGVSSIEKSQITVTERAEVGLLKRLSNYCRRSLRELARTNLLGVVYDNINLNFKVAEQTVTQKDTVENGTCATAFTLHNASADDLKTADYLQSFVNAPSLKPTDIILTAEENRLLRERLIHTVMRIIITFDGGRIPEKLKKEVRERTPSSNHIISLHRTKFYPLPTMHIDESSTTGNAEVITEILRELQIEVKKPFFGSVVRIIAGDQLSIARLRGIILNRLGHDSFAMSFLWAVFMPGLFHYKLALTHGIMDVHYGKSNSPTNPGSLSFHNTVLDRKPIVLTSFPPFRVARDLIFASSYARTFVCFENATERSFDVYTAHPDDLTYDQLYEDCAKVVDKFANPKEVSKLRNARKKEEKQFANSGTTGPRTAGDMVFENAVLFLRDALVLREFCDAIKAGDSGRVILALKQIALMYRGMGRTKYAYEMFHLIHNFTYIWPEPLKKVILDNWLVNTTGKENGFSEIDLLQEHLNFWTKVMCQSLPDIIIALILLEQVIYAAHGSNASWEWLAMIAPCIHILRHLATQVHQDLGSRQGTKHASPELQRDINLLKESLQQHKVYEIQSGRIIDQEDAVVANVVSEGLKSLKEPLAEYNKGFRRLQQRCRMKPLVGEAYVATERSGEDEPQMHTAVQVDDLDSIEVDDGNVDDNENDDLDLIWETLDSGEDEGARFSLESAEDVALDMDAVDDVEDL